MSLEIVTFNSLSAPTQLEVASMVADYTNGLNGEQPQMLPVTSPDILSKYAGTVAIYEGVFAGYVGATEPEQWNAQAMSEVGSLWVPKEHRQRGIAHHLVSILGEQLVDVEIVPYGFCNSSSLPIFLDAGFTEVDAKSVPSSALSLCAVCPSKPASGCCDTIVVMEPKS